MPDTTNEPQTQQTDGTTPTQSAPPSTEPQPGQRGLWDSGLKVEEDAPVPSWMRGKTFKEIADYSEQVMQAALTAAPAATPQAPQQQPQQTYQAQPQAAPAAGMPDPNLMYSDAAKYQEQLAAYYDNRLQQQIQQASQPFLKSQVGIARNAAKSDPDDADVWSEYGHEIDQEMLRVPLEARANPDAWKTAAAYVAGKHRREMMQRYAERNGNQRQDAGTVSSDGGIPPGANGSAGAVGDEIDQLFSEDHPAVERFKEQGMNAQRVRQHATAMGHSAEKYAEMLKRKATIRG